MPTYIPSRWGGGGGIEPRTFRQGVDHRAYLGELLGDASEDVVVEVPGLSEVLHVARAHVLPAPVLRLHQVPPVRLRQEVTSFNVCVLKRLLLADGVS